MNPRTCHSSLITALATERSRGCRHRRQPRSRQTTAPAGRRPAKPPHSDLERCAAGDARPRGLLAGRRSTAGWARTRRRRSTATRSRTRRAAAEPAVEPLDGVHHHRGGRGRAVRRRRFRPTSSSRPSSHARVSLVARGAGRALPLDAGVPAAAEPGRAVRRWRADSGAERRAARRCRYPPKPSRQADAAARPPRGTAAGADAPAAARTADTTRKAGRRRHRQQGDVRADGHRCIRARRLLRAGHDRQRARPAAVGEWKVNGVSSTRRSTTTRSCSGTRTRAREGEDSRRARTTRSAWSGSISARSTTASTARRNRRRSAGPSRTAACG